MPQEESWASASRAVTYGVVSATVLLVTSFLGVLPFAAWSATWRFTDVTAHAGVLTTHGYAFGYFDMPDMIAGGAAAADIDGDGDVDLFVLRGDLGPARMYRNRGDGRFDEVGDSAGVAIHDGIANGAAFADVDGDGSLDLLVGGIYGAPPRLFLNDSRGRFTEATAASGLASSKDTFSGAFGDYDRDGWLDLFLTHWNREGGNAGHLWRNLGGGRFEDMGPAAGIEIPYITQDFSFTPNFADIDSDGWPDLLVAADFGTSRIFRNLRDGTFGDVTTGVISDENGMGAAVADYDNDGDLDWFVSSIWDPNGVSEGNWGVTGNRLYRNLGDGSFEDATEKAGVRAGYWGWGSCFADFDNDGHLDLFHVNGFPVFAATEYHADSARLFVSNGDGTFTERSAELGVADTLQGRGVICFDYDRDGDLDIFIANNAGPTRLYRNDGGNKNHFLTVRLHGRGPNTWAVGARIWARTAGGTQMRELRAGNNYLSTDPIEAHFGLGSYASVEELRIQWPDGREESLKGVAADRVLELWEGSPVPGVGPAWLIVLTLLLGGVGIWGSNRLRLVRAIAVAPAATRHGLDRPDSGPHRAERCP